MNFSYLYTSLIFCLFVLSSSAQKIRIGTYVFKDGGEYQGELFRGKPYGKGVTKYKNGDVYEGEYVKGKRELRAIHPSPHHEDTESPND